MARQRPAILAKCIDKCLDEVMLVVEEQVFRLPVILGVGEAGHLYALSKSPMR